MIGPLESWVKGRGQKAQSTQAWHNSSRSWQEAPHCTWERAAREQHEPLQLQPTGLSFLLLCLLTGQLSPKTDKQNLCAFQANRQGWLRQDQYKKLKLSFSKPRELPASSSPGDLLLGELPSPPCPPSAHRQGSFCGQTFFR